MTKKTSSTWERTALGALAGVVVGMSLITVAYRGETPAPVEVEIVDARVESTTESAWKTQLGGGTVELELARTMSKGFSR